MIVRIFIAELMNVKAATKLASLSLVLLPASGSLSVFAQKRGWRVPTYEGLTLVKSRKADVVRRFGKPKWVFHPEDEYDNPVKSLISYGYENVGGFEGRTEVVMKARTGVVIGVDLTPAEGRPLPSSDVLEKFGRDYVERGIGLGPCPTPRDIRDYKPVARYEYPAFLVYPQKGVIVMVKEDKNVGSISYALSCP
jgi:hypothetical protein